MVGIDRRVALDIRESVLWASWLRYCSQHTVTDMDQPICPALRYT
jgi:hypothetical protein